ncbi:hypothetical protein CBL_12687 [Carabus blaptoides fortunei]
MSDISDEELWDTSDESDTEHILLQLAAQCVAIEERNNRTFGEKRIARYNDHQFVHHLGITKQLALSLSEKFERSSYYQDIKDRGRHSLSAKNQLYVFLWFVTHQNLCYRDVGRYFGISLSTVHAILNRIDGDVPLDENQQHYNQNLNFCIDQMQLCFTSLKERFRGLNCLKVRNTKLQHLIIKSCFVLYNLNYDAETHVGEDHNYTTQQMDLSSSLEVILTTENES